jgi:DNA-binding MarR family transcriptional regulator
MPRRKPYYALETLEANRSVGFLLKRCSVLMTQVAEARFAKLASSFTQWLVLVNLTKQEHTSATRLSAELGHDMGALTRVVDELERRGLARRERSRRDRRAVEIAITAAGRKEAQEGKRVIVELLNNLVEPLSTDEIDTLIALLQRLFHHLQRVTGSSALPAPSPTGVDRSRRARKPASGGTQ